MFKNIKEGKVLKKIIDHDKSLYDSLPLNQHGDFNTNDFILYQHCKDYTYRGYVAEDNSLMIFDNGFRLKIVPIKKNLIKKFNPGNFSINDDVIVMFFNHGDKYCMQGKIINVLNNVFEVKGIHKDEEKTLQCLPLSLFKSNAYDYNKLMAELEYHDINEMSILPDINVSTKLNHIIDIKKTFSEICITMKLTNRAQIKFNVLDFVIYRYDSDETISADIQVYSYGILLHGCESSGSIEYYMVRDYFDFTKVKVSINDLFKYEDYFRSPSEKEYVIGFENESSSLYQIRNINSTSVDGTKTYNVFDLMHSKASTLRSDFFLAGDSINKWIQSLSLHVGKTNHIYFSYNV